MDYTTLPIPPDARLMPESVAVTSLYEALQQLSDPRRGQGKRYELALILCFLVLAKLAGETSLSGATDWIRQRAAFLADQLRLRRKSVPCQMTYCNVLARVDAKHLDEILATFFARWKPSSAVERNRAVCTRHKERPITLIWLLTGKLIAATTRAASSGTSAQLL